MTFEEFKNQALALLREAEGKGYLGVDHPIASKKKELQRLFMQGLDDGAERSQRLLQLKRLDFGSPIDQWTCHCQSIEEWEKLFDEVENITGQEAQKVLEEEEKEKEEEKERQEKREERERLSNIPKKVKAKLPSKIIRKIKTGDYLLSPRSYNYITLKTKRGEGEVKLPNYSFKAEALIDFIFHNIAEQLKFGAEPKEYDIIPVEEFESICKLGEGTSIFKPIIFETSEIRKKLNVSSDWTNEKIVEAAKELRDKPITARAVRIYSDENKKYRQGADWYSSICSDVLVDKTDKIAPKTKNIQHKIGFVPALITSLLFYNDVINKRYSLFPTKVKKFYRMKKEVVRLYRYLSLWDFSILTLPMAMEILRYKKGRNVTEMWNKVQCYLDEMCELGLIEFWMRGVEKKGMETTWYVFVTQTVEQVFGEKRKKELNGGPHKI